MSSEFPCSGNGPPPSPPKALKVMLDPGRSLLQGFGRMAQRHLNNLRVLEPDVHIVCLRHADHAPAPPGIDHVVYNLEQALAIKPDMALIRQYSFKYDSTTARSVMSHYRNGRNTRMKRLNTWCQTVSIGCRPMENAAPGNGDRPQRHVP